MTTNSKTCPQCGTPLPVNAPGGLCPRCVMAMNMATQTEFTGDVGPHGTKVIRPVPSPEELAAKFPQLEILELLGRGGMGAVYKARQKSLGRMVALKILPPGIGDERTFAKRFEHEARALASLNHPNIVVLYEFGEADGLYFFLMEYVDGVTLRQLLNTGRVSPREALAIVPQICDALQYAHDQGIVHRDIKPENILMDRRGRVKVADFGLAKLVGEQGRAGSPLPADASSGGGAGGTRPTSDLTDAGKVMGTPQYMAPEQIEKPTEVDHRADIYALGVVFYQMLTGELPGKRIEPPSKKVQIDVRLDEIVLRALEKNPERRYEQASVLKTQVENVSATMESQADSGMDKKLAIKSKHWNPDRIPWQIWVVVALLGLEGVGILYGIKQNPVSLYWLGAKVVIVSGLLLKWRPVFVLALIVTIFNCLYFAPVNLAASGLNLLLFVLIGSASRFYFPRKADSKPDSQTELPETVTRKMSQPVRVAIVLMLVMFGIGVALAISPFVFNRYISAVVTNADTGEPVGRANVSIWSPDPVSGSIINRTPRSGVDGKLRIFLPRKLITRDFKAVVEVHAAGYKSASWDFSEIETMLAKGRLTFPLTPENVGKSEDASAGPQPKGDKESKQIPPQVSVLPPVLERILPDPDNGGGKGNRETLNLRTGEQLSVVAEASKEQGGRLRALVASKGDLFAEYDDYVSKRWALITANLRLADFPARQWDSATAQEIVDALKQPTVISRVQHFGATLYLLPQDFVPLTLAFETREGSRGLLQITKFEDNPRSLKIRYKLLDQTSEANPALKPIPPRAAELMKETESLYRTRNASNDPNAEKEFREKLAALTREMDSVLAGTIAEPLLKEQRAETAKFAAAQKANDTAKANEAKERLQALGKQIMEMIYPEALQSNGKSEKAKASNQITRKPIASAPGQYKLTLANGVSFEVIAICRNPRQTNFWWKPDGTPFNKPPYEIVELAKLGPTRGPNVTVNPTNEFLVLIRHHIPFDWPKDVTFSHGLDWSPRPSDIEFPATIRDVASGKKFSAAFICFDEAPESVDFQTQVARGPWEPIAIYDGKQTKELVNGLMVVCSTPVVPERRTDFQFEVMHNVDREAYDMRMMAKLKNGETREVEFHPGPIRGNPSKGFATIWPDELNPADVKQYVLERARWERGEIEGIALKPKTTKVSAVAPPVNSATSEQKNEFSFSHREKLGQSVLDASRDFAEEHQWKLNGERGGVTNGISSVKIEATDLNGKRVMFHDAQQADGTCRFTVKVESGSEFSADRIGTAIARRLKLRAGWEASDAQKENADQMNLALKTISFTPVLERELPIDIFPANFLDLDENKLINRPVEERFASREDALRWLLESGVDVVAQARQATGDAWLLGSMTFIGERLRMENMGARTGPFKIGDGSVFCRVSEDEWKNLSAEQCVQKCRTNAFVNQAAVNGAKFPGTFLFKTAEGGCGILQILGFSNDQRALQIRYKVVQNKKTDVDLSPLKLSSEQRAALLTEAQQAFSKFVRRDPKTRGENIPEEFWGPITKSLRPIRVVDDRVNIKIVLSDDEIETGLYINLPISSFAPNKTDFLEFIPLSQPDDHVFGQIYFYALQKTKERQNR